jgi:biotin-dependent carboxylase-like uncharacterized protein
VPGSGALDRDALRLANRLVGNADGAAGLEVLFGGLRLVAEGSVRLALTGGWQPLSVDGRDVPWGTPVSVPDGATVAVGRGGPGLRSWLALAGGVETEPVLGSRSTDTLTGLGPSAVGAGAVLSIGPRPGRRDLGVADAVAPVAIGDPANLEVSLGPRDRWFEPASVATFGSADYQVSPHSNRTAVRLLGPPLVRSVVRELPSEGLVTGAVQVPSDGHPLVFLADHPTTGGYPVLGVVSTAALSICAQLRPGDRVRFRVTRR